MTNNSGVVARSACDRTTVTSLLLDVADDGTFGHTREWKHVANSELSLLAAVDESASMQTLGRDEGFSSLLVTVGIAEHNTGKRGATVCQRMSRGQLGMNSRVHQGFHRPASVVNDFPHDPANVTIAFGEVKRSEPCRRLVVVGMGLELGAQGYRVDESEVKKKNQKNTK